MWRMASRQLILIIITILIKLTCSSQNFNLRYNNDKIAKAAATLAERGFSPFDKINSTDQFNNTINDDTVSSDPKDVKFYLYNNPQNVNAYTELFIGDTDTLTQSNIRGDLSLKILIHGFLSGPASDYPQNVKNASLTKNMTSGSQILIVGWVALSTIVNQDSLRNTYDAYTTAVEINVPIVGNRLGEFLTFLINNNRTSLDRLHFVGHSLGAHVSGLAGNFLKQQFGQPAARISGLDPAGPLFSGDDQGRPLTSEDAEFVDVIHTNDGFLGKSGQIGHADFYPKGSSLTESCGNGTDLGLMEQIVASAACAHSQSHMLYARSLGSTAMKACECSSYFYYVIGFCYCDDWEGNQAIMGDNCDASARGSYYLIIEPWM